MAIYKQKDGLYTVRIYYTVNGRQKEKRKRNIKLYKEAQAVERQLAMVERTDDFHIIDISKVIIGNNEIKPATKRLYTAAHNHIIKFFDCRISKVNNAMIVEFKDFLAKQGHSVSNKNSLIRYLKQIEKKGNRLYNTNYSIFANTDIYKQSQINKLKIIDLEQLQELLKQNDDIIYKSMYSILFFTGLRIGELMGLTWNKLKENILTVDCQLDMSKNVLSSTKTLSSNRDIYIDDYTLSVFDKLKKHYQQFDNFSNQWYMFGGTSYITYGIISRQLKRDIEKVKTYYPDFPLQSFHDFRHSHASFMICNNFNIVYVSKRLGHSDITMTLDTYTHIIEKLKTTENMKLNEITDKLRTDKQKSL